MMGIDPQTYEIEGRPRVGFVSCFFSSRRRHTRFDCDWSSDVCSSDLEMAVLGNPEYRETATTTVASRLLKISKNDFWQLMARDVDRNVLRKIEEQAARRADRKSVV